MTSSDPTESSALSALTSLLRGAVKKPTAAALERGLQDLRTRLVGGNVNRHRVIRWSVLAAAVVACAVSVGVAVSFHRSGESAAERAVALSRIEGGKILDGGYLSESGNAGIKLYFDEGSEFELRPGTRGRLRALNADGALLAIEHGSASLRITHRRDHRWSVEAGPFLVTVKGTDFSVEWDPASEQFELELRRGRVAVNGPVVGEGLALKPGQKLTVSLRKAETIITEVRPHAAGEASLPVPPPTSEIPVAPAASEPKLANAPEARISPTVSGTGGERRWREALANGRWDEILTDAERDGIEATLEKASSDDLFALADAARYRRRADLARQTLLAQRRRFPNSPRSLDAIFFLGRVEELRSSGRRSAIQRYEEYLSRAPAGTYASEALGRKMILTKELEGPANARAIAGEYLRRFPEGSYAGAARALQRAP